MNTSIEPNLNSTEENSSRWLQNSDLFVLKLGSEIPIALFPIDEEIKVCFSLSFFAVLRAEGYFKDHLDQGYTKRIFCGVDYVLSDIQYGTQYGTSGSCAFEMCLVRLRNWIFNFVYF